MGEILADTKPLLAAIDGGRVLDVATGRGGYIHELADGLASYDEIVGIDSQASLAEDFERAVADHQRVRFEARDALDPGFADGSFDLASVSASLHHFADPAPVLTRMRRLVRPGGHLVVYEMYREARTEPQLTHVLLHHWWAAVDTTRGIVHRPTYRRADLLEIVDRLDLEALELADVADLGDDPLDPATIATLDGAIERYQAHTAAYPELRRQGEDLRRRLHEVGAQGAAMLVAIGRIPG
jgi:SAM-dependent methyltransferase